MHSITKRVMYLITAILFCLATIASADFNPLVNEKVMTYIDVSTQLVTVVNKIKVVNKFIEPIESYLFVVDPHWMQNVSYIGASDENNNHLNVNRVYTDDSWLKYEILFQNSLTPGETESIKVSYIITNYLQSYPKSVAQNDKHLVLFSFNVYFFSVYFTESQTALLHIGTTEVTSVDGAPFEILYDSNNALKYGPYYDMDPISEHPSIIHYENKSPFLTVERLDRFIKISHWGYLTVWEHISLVHTGPTLKGPFERQSVPKPPPDTRIESFVTTLPADAKDVYLKDVIGYIWSFDVDSSDPLKVEVNIKPRFLMYGGWKTEYEIGYTLPISNYVSYDDYDSSFTLGIPVFDQIFDSMVIKDAQIYIILPEGASFQDINPYFTLENNTNKRYCYFIDILCREVVSFQIHNMVYPHSSKVFLTYSYQQWFLLSKALLIAMIIWTVFLLYLAVSPSYKTSSLPQKKMQTSQPQSSNELSTKQDKKLKKNQPKSKVKKC